jgi:hypothetical protein
MDGLNTNVQYTEFSVNANTSCSTIKLRVDKQYCLILFPITKEINGLIIFSYKIVVILLKQGYKFESGHTIFVP